MTNDHDMPQATRRRFLIDTAALAGATGIGLSLATGPASATPASMRAAIRKVVGEAPVKKGRLKIDLPPLIENGNAVALTVTAERPFTSSPRRIPSPTSSASSSARARVGRCSRPASGSPIRSTSSPLPK